MNFAAQYQQRPAPAGGGMVKAAWFPRYKARRAARRSTASSRAGTPPTSPPSLPTIPSAPPGAIKAPRFCLIDVLRKKLSYPELKRAAHEQNALFRPQTILIEDRASGTQLIQDLIDAGLSRVDALFPRRRQDHAAPCPDGDDRERLRLLAGGGALARRLPRRAHASRSAATTTRSTRPSQFLAWAKRILFEPAGP